MPIKRCSEQSSKTLEEFYTDLCDIETPDWANSGKAMLRLITTINTLFKETPIWGLTSLARLVLQDSDNSASGWYVIISSVAMENYYFEYLLPADRQPWDNAYVKGEASSLAEAENYLLIAMRESEGWKGNNELNNLLAAKKLLL